MDEILYGEVHGVVLYSHGRHFTKYVEVPMLYAVDCFSFLSVAAYCAFSAVVRARLREERVDRWRMRRLQRAAGSGAVTTCIPTAMTGAPIREHHVSPRIRE
jgi:hypothetical protein